jgi:DNA repair protein RadC
VTSCSSAVVADSEPRPLSGTKKLIERISVEGSDDHGDADLLALLLGVEQGDAVKLLDDAGGIEKLSAVSANGLVHRHGLTPARASRLMAAVELGRRVQARSLQAVRAILGTSKEVAAWARPRLAHLEHEQMWVLCLDGRNGLRAARRVAEGGLHGCSIAPRDILRVAVREAASAIVLVHNHPSGDPTPSREDVELTGVVAKAAETIGTPLVDHVIVAGTSHASLFDLGLLGFDGARLNGSTRT